jgi:hypothetical protein
MRWKPKQKDAHLNSSESTIEFFNMLNVRTEEGNNKKENIQR